MRAVLVDAWRGLRSRRAAAWVAMLGLTLAFAACLLAGLLAIALSDPDPAIDRPDRVVLLDFKGNPPGQPSPWFTASPVVFGSLLKARHLPITAIARTAEDGLDVDVDGRLQQLFPLLADPEAVALLAMPALHGDLQATLARRDAIALTPESVRKVFGALPSEQALGRQLTARGRVYTVTAIVPPTDPRSPLGRHDAILGYESQANSLTEEQRDAIYQINGRVYARLADGVSAGEVGDWMREAFIAHPGYAQLPAEWRTGREAAYFRGLPLTRLLFEGAANEQCWRVLGALGAACAVLLLLAALNHMNLQTASLLRRQRETALRRSLGASGLHLVALWALEALLPLLASAAAALLLAWWAAPAAANWMGLAPDHPVADPIPLRAWAGLALAVALLWPLTLAVPAVAALRRPAAPALQGRTASEGPWGRRTRQGLLAVQLCGALTLLALAGVLAVQQQHLLHADRGFDTRNRLSIFIRVDPSNIPNLDAFLAALDRDPAVQHRAFHGVLPARQAGGGAREMYASADGQRQLLRVAPVSAGFFDTYGMTVLAGRPQAGRGEVNVVIDAKAARGLGFASPQSAVGALLRGGGGFLQEGQELRRVVAVVKDVKLESAREPALPQAFIVDDDPQWDLTVSGADMAALRQAVETAWERHGPPLQIELQTADEQRFDAYRQEQRLSTLLTVVALLAAGVAMLGTYALAADTLRRRRAELVLRRLHGAGHRAITAQVGREFVVPLAAAAAVGIPLAGWLGGRYLAGFIDRVDPVIGLVLPLAIGLGATALVTAFSALRHVRQALALRPIEALR